MSIVELHEVECQRLLRTVSVGRVGVTIDALPAVLPVNFMMNDDAVVFRTVAGTKLNAATSNAVVAFEADSAEHPEGAWSVLVRGVARELTDPDELAAVRSLPLESWALDSWAPWSSALGDKAEHYVRIEPTLVTGRRIVTTA